MRTLVAVADLPNTAIAAAFDELGDLYELDGAIVHRVVAYRNAAKAVREAPMSVAALAREGRATELAGIGKTLEEKILALLETGMIPSAERLRAIDLPTIRSHGYAFQVELTYRALRAGFTVREVPIVFRDRLHGHSKMSLRIALEAAWLVPMLRRRD